MNHKLALALLLSGLSVYPVLGQKTDTYAKSRVPTYADIADMSLTAPTTASVRIRKAEKLKGKDAATAINGRKRYLITADVLALIRSRESISPRITYVIDVAPDSQGKFPKLVGGEAIIFALPVPDQPTELRLVSPDAQIAATPDHLARIRTILYEASLDGAPPPINGVGEAFHVAGAIPGEGETQIFLNTATGKPVTITVIRSGNASPAWRVSLGEVVDQASGPPVRNSLLWYRLACFLPKTLPEPSVASLEADLAAIAREDYATVIAGLGNCPRVLAMKI